jgi:hypothetical protein
VLLIPELLLHLCCCYYSNSRHLSWLSVCKVEANASCRARLAMKCTRQSLHAGMSFHHDDDDDNGNGDSEYDDNIINCDTIDNGFQQHDNELS